MMFRPLVAQARACDRGTDRPGPLTQAARLLDRYGDAAVLFAEDSRTLTVLRALEEEAGHVQ
jgi:hypothetical protein